MYLECILTNFKRVRILPYLCIGTIAEHVQLPDDIIVNIGINLFSINVISVNCNCSVIRQLLGNLRNLTKCKVSEIRKICSELLEERFKCCYHEFHASRVL